MTSVKDDALSEMGAASLANIIERYWAARGVRVHAYPYPILHGDNMVWGVRSNLRFGLPKGENGHAHHG